MELRQLRSFIKAAELLHFTRAADLLNISQPALSNQIAQLEEELKTDLFARVGRQVKLTESGKIFLECARKFVFELETSIQNIDSITQLLRGELSIAAN
ncbi:MAG TPA: LysR family transcriptional regulator [Drouetiella sp.]